MNLLLVISSEGKVYVKKVNLDDIQCQKLNDCINESHQPLRQLNLL